MQLDLGLPWNPENMLPDVPNLHYPILHPLLTPPALQCPNQAIIVDNGYISVYNKTVLLNTIHYIELHRYDTSMSSGNSPRFIYTIVKLRFLTTLHTGNSAYYQRSWVAR